MKSGIQVAEVPGLSLHIICESDFDLTTLFVDTAR